jgi:hypothetical protein
MINVFTQSLDYKSVTHIASLADVDLFNFIQKDLHRFVLDSGAGNMVVTLKLADLEPAPGQLKVFLESKSAELIALFEDDSVFAELSPAFIRYAESRGLTISDSIEESVLPNPKKSINP